MRKNNWRRTEKDLKSLQVQRIWLKPHSKAMILENFSLHSWASFFSRQKTFLATFCSICETVEGISTKIAKYYSCAVSKQLLGTCDTFGVSQVLFIKMASTVAI